MHREDAQLMCPAKANVMAAVTPRARGDEVAHLMTGMIVVEVMSLEEFREIQAAESASMVITPQHGGLGFLERRIELHCLVGPTPLLALDAEYERQ